MSKNLVIVESPGKIKTLKKYLGKDFEVLASYGHVRDLVPKEGAVDPANHFAMRYQVLEKNAKHVQAIARALKKATTLYGDRFGPRRRSHFVAFGGTTQGTKRSR
jgi:DNA topoisomerase I